MEVLFNLFLIFIVIIAMGLFIAFSPVLFTAELAVITRSEDSQRDVVFLVAGVATPIILITVASFLFLNPSQSYAIQSPFKLSSLTLAPLLDLFVGIIFVVSSRLWLRSSDELKIRALKKNKKGSFISKITSPAALYWFGFIKMIMSITSLATILLAIRLIKSSIDGVILQVIAILVLTITAILPFVTIAALERINPRTFSHVKRASDSMALWDYRRISANIVFVGGCLLIALGLFS